MTYSSRNDLISCGFGRVARVAVLSVCSSSLMISLQISMHSLQTYTPGPAISFLTSFCDLPQKEQQRSSSGLRKFAIKSCQSPVASCQLGVGPNVTSHLTSCQSRRQTSTAHRARPVYYSRG